MSLDFIVLPLLLMAATGPIIYTIKMHRERRIIREERNRLAHEVLRQVKEPFVKSKMSGPDRDWIEMRNEVRRRRRSIPKASAHIYSFKFQVGKQ